MKVVWTHLAAKDRRNIRAHIAKDNHSSALHLDALFSEAVKNLSLYPYIGRIGRVPNTRECIAHKNYILVYDVTEDMVRILRLLHVARDYP